MASIFLGGLIQVGIFWGIQNNQKNRISANKVQPNSAWDFLGIHFWSRDFFGFVRSSRDFFLSFDFCSHSIIPVT